MKSFFVILLLILSPTFSFTAAAGESALAEYLRGCRLMADAIQSHDKIKLQKAIECFDNADASPGEITSLKKDNSDLKPEYLFTADFADELLLNDFSLAKLDPETLIRNGNPDSALSLFHLYLNPGETAHIEFEGAEDMNVSVTSGGVAKAELSISDPTNKYSESVASTREDDNATLLWHMQEPATVTATVKNISDTGATFVVIFN